jgi:hypothetical protein
MMKNKAKGRTACVERTGTRKHSFVLNTALGPVGVNWPTTSGTPPPRVPERYQLPSLRVLIWMCIGTIK